MGGGSYRGVRLSYPLCPFRRALFKARLARQLGEMIAARALSETEAAGLLDWPPALLVDVLRGRFRTLGEGRLLEALARFGREVRIVVGPPTHPPRTAGRVELEVLAEQAIASPNPGRSARLAAWPPTPKGPRITMKSATITLPDDIEQALEQFVAEQPMPLQLTTVVQTAVREYLGERGYLPCSAALRIRPAQRGSGHEDVSVLHATGLSRRSGTCRSVSGSDHHLV